MRYGYLNAHTDAGEGSIGTSKEFRDEDPLWKLDVVGDWKAEINELYRKTYKEYEAYIRKEHPNVNRTTFNTILGMLGHGDPDPES